MQLAKPAVSQLALHSRLPGTKRPSLFKWHKKLHKTWAKAQTWTVNLANLDTFKNIPIFVLLLCHFKMWYDCIYYCYTPCDICSKLYKNQEATSGAEKWSQCAKAAFPQMAARDWWQQWVSHHWHLCWNAQIYSRSNHVYSLVQKADLVSTASYIASSALSDRWVCHMWQT